MISGSGGLIKTSNGALVLSSSTVNTYTGGTTISAGTVDVKSTSSLGSGDVAVASGATMTLKSATCLASTASLLLSTSAIVTNSFTGTNNIGGLSFDGGTTFQAEGTWGTSSVAHTNTTFFKGTGKLNVIGMTTTTTVASSANPSTYGQAVTFTASVSSEDGTPTGTVQFLINGTNFGSAVTLSGGSANTAAPSTLPAGAYTVTAAYSGDSDFTASTGTLAGGQSVNKAGLSITANADSKTYGQTKTYGSGSTAFTSSGLQNSETIGTVTLASSGGAATAAVSGSPYTITPSAATGGSFNANNYTITYYPGNLTVSPTALTITASAQSKTYGTALALGTSAFTSSGLANSETIGAVTLTASGSPAGNTATAPVGSYTITPTAATGGTFNAANYSITYNTGTLTVNQAVLTVTASNDSKTYGQTKSYGAGQTAFTSSGLQNSETIGSVTITASGGTAANAAVGSYTLTPSAATGGTFTRGQLQRHLQHRHADGERGGADRDGQRAEQGLWQHRPGVDVSDHQRRAGGQRQFERQPDPRGG